MADNNQNFSLYAGNVLKVNVDVDVSLAGFDVSWATSRSSGSCFSTVALIEKKTSDASLTVDDAGNGLLSFILDEADTVDLQPGSYEHQVVIYDGTGAPVTVTTGTMTINRRIFNTP